MADHVMGARAEQEPNWSAGTCKPLL